MICGVLGEGPSDDVLVPILRWMMQQLCVDEPEVRWIDYRHLGTGRTLASKVDAALRLQPCDLLFIHRDADKQPPELRYAEIRAAAAAQPYVGVVPVRMTEAWLLVDEQAIRQASGRVTGKAPLGLPRWGRIEEIADPKALLQEALLLAHEGRGRRRRGFDLVQARKRIADLVEDWSPLRSLPAFQRLERETGEALGALGVTVRSPAR
ncbi:MAG: hypothetical protein JXX28_04960, partial [Deltaproteobacteria bacterium]|nr:hypothetical protein [Deltaproteobacteria bacterium]